MSTMPAKPGGVAPVLLPAVGGMFVISVLDAAGMISTGSPLALIRWLTGSRHRPSTSMAFSAATTEVRRSTALMREISSRVENGLVI